MGAHHGPDDPHRHTHAGDSLRIGIGGPVGSGKTELVASLCRAFADELELVVVTNDVFTTEDAAILERKAVLPVERIAGVETGCCPHTAIRDDISENLDVVERLEEKFRPDLVLLESGGDNLTATFSKALVDLQLFVIDVAGGDDIPRKKGPGLLKCDLLVVNKTDLAPYVGVNLDRMLADAVQARGERAVIATNARSGAGIKEVADAILAAVLFRV